MATCSSTFAWEIPWTVEPGGLKSVAWQQVRHDFTTNKKMFHKNLNLITFEMYFICIAKKYFIYVYTHSYVKLISKWTHTQFQISKQN